jgi:hypothetical protein
MKKILAVALGLVFLSSGAAFAGKGQWKKNHPRRAEVNGRLKNQDKRIDAGVKDGQLSKQEAKQLHKEDRQTRKEERRMAAKDGGHLTKADQAKLNRRENRESKQIYNERHEGAENGSAAAPAAPAAPTTGQ